MTRNMRILGTCSQRGFRWGFSGTGAVLHHQQEMVYKVRKEYIQL